MIYDMLPVTLLSALASECQDSTNATIARYLIAHAGDLSDASREELIVIFSYTGDYFTNRSLTDSLARLDRPRIWMVAGTRKQQPACVYGCLSFASEGTLLGHPFQLEMAEALIAQEYARTTPEGRHAE